MKELMEGKFISQCLYCGEFVEKMIELCPFCSSEGIISITHEDKIDWNRKPT